MNRIYKSEKLYKEFVKYLEKTYVQFLSDVEDFKKDGDRHICFLSANHDQHGNPHLFCNYVPKNEKDINCYGSHGYGVPSELILEWFLDFRNMKRQNKLRRILGKQDLEIKKLYYKFDYNKYINEMLGGN